MRLDRLHRAYPSLHPFGIVHWVPEQLNMKAVTGACKLNDGCSLKTVFAIPSAASSGICHSNKGQLNCMTLPRAQPEDSILYYYYPGPSQLPGPLIMVSWTMVSFLSSQLLLANSSSFFFIVNSLWDFLSEYHISWILFGTSSSS